MGEGNQDEGSLREALAFAGRIISTIREPFVILGDDLRVELANRAFYRTFGVEPGSIQGRSFFELGDNQWDIPDLRRLLDRLAEEDAGFDDYEVRHDFAGLGPRVMLLNARRLVQDGGRILLAIEDVTERKDSERALAESRGRTAESARSLAGTLDALTSHVAVLDERGVILQVNAAWRRFATENGLKDEDQSVGQNYLDSCIPTDDGCIEDDRVLDGIRSVIEGRADRFTCEYPCHSPAERRWFVMRVSRFAGPGPVRVVVSHDDITERVLAEQERGRLLDAAEAARREAEAANRMKDDFLATLSHELRTPLNAILGWSKILLSHDVDPEDLGEGLAAIERNAASQAQIIEDLLDISRIVSGNFKIEVQRVDLREVIEAAVAAVAPVATAKGIRVHKLLDSLAGPVSGDPVRLQQVVWNLLTNAVKFTPKGGKVQVLLERVNSHLEVSVIDSGQGIRPEFLPHVFDRFRQADSTSTRRHGGLGLGLAIVKQLAELHGGAVRAKSPGEGQGSTFTVSLPITVVHPEHPSPTPGRPGAPDRADDSWEGRALAGVRVLVVDDEPDARQLIRRALVGSQAEVALASSAAEAIDLVARFRPEVLVSDIGMPDRDGYDLIRRVRAQHSSHDLPAAALTAFARAEDRRRALLAGFQIHLAKPVDPAELVAVVASLAGRTGVD